MEFSEHEYPESSSDLFYQPKLSKREIPWSILIVGLLVSVGGWSVAQQYTFNETPSELTLYSHRTELIFLSALLVGILITLMVFVLVWVLRSRYVQALEIGRVLKIREREAKALAEKSLQENSLLKQSREEHLSSEAKYKDVLERSLHGIFRADAEGRFLEVNAAMAQIFGYDSPEDMLASQADLGGDMYVDSTTRNELIRALLEEGSVEKFEVQVRRKDGPLIWLSMFIRAIRDVHQTVLHFKGVVSDITAYKDIESQLAHSQKMDVIGRLAGGVAHDFNNLLLVIINRAQMLEAQVPEDSTICRNARAIIETGERASKLTRQLLIFSRKQAFQSVAVDLNTTIKDVSRLLIRLIGEDITLTLKFSPTSCIVKTDPTQLEQAVMNLAVNARDAMPQGGELRIETSVIHVDAKLSTHFGVPLEQKSYVVLSVTDSGCGMEKSVRDHLFEPFFTTKAPNKGTGLGLSVVYGMTRQCGGQVHVDSELGRGSTFKIYLPKASSGTEIIDKKSSHRLLLGSSGIQRGVLNTSSSIGVVLLVEDDVLVCEVVGELLRSLQYEVLVSHTPKDAMGVFEKEKDRIEILLTDVIMPDMSGPQLARSLCQKKPTLAVVFMSGYTDSSLSAQGVHRDDVNFLQKPFTLEDLCEKLTHAEKMAHKQSAT